MKGEKDGSDASHSTPVNSLHVVIVIELQKRTQIIFWNRETLHFFIQITMTNWETLGLLCRVFCCRLKDKRCLHINGIPKIMA